MAMSINGVPIPAGIANRGKYKFNPPEIVGRNGLGDPVAAGYASIEWTFSYLSFSAVDGFDWWKSTLLTNLRFRRFTTAVLVDDGRTETAYTNCIVYRPTYENIFANWYENVVVKIDQIM
jgi:hypothetical protein